MRRSRNTEAHNKWKLKVNYHVESRPLGGFSFSRWQLKHTALTWNKAKEHLRVYKAKFFQRAFDLVPSSTQSQSGHCLVGRGSGLQLWCRQRKALAERRSVGEGILSGHIYTARKTRPGMRIKPQSATINHCGFGSLPGQRMGHTTYQDCSR